MSRRFVRVALAVALFGASVAAQAQTEIQWWHSMTGALGDRVNEIANGFNASQKDYKVVPVYKGTYPESMTAAIAAFRAGNAPHILQVFEVGTATMMNAKGAIKPVYVMMKEAKEPFDPKNYLAGGRRLLHRQQGQHAVAAVQQLDADVLRQQGRVQEGRASIPRRRRRPGPSSPSPRPSSRPSGQECVYTTGWPSWVHIENFSAWHNLPIGTKSNGFDGLDTEFKINSPYHVAHINMLADYAKKGWFTYSGRTNQGEARFFSGECAMLTSSSAAQANIRKNAKFDFSVNFLPYNHTIEGAPQNSIIGGATLWVMSGKKADDYKGVTKFFSYLSSPEVQANWHQGTGYVPITNAAFDLTKKSGYLREESRAPTWRSASSTTRRPPPTRRACASATSCRAAK